MICLICRQAETMDEFVSVTFERGEMRLVVDGVPARLCAECGEAYVGEDVAVRLLLAAEAISATGELERVLSFDVIA